MNESCLNNLSDVYNQYCKDARPLEKHMRDIFVTGTVDDVLQNFQVNSVVTTIPKVHISGYAPKFTFGTRSDREQP